MEPEKGAADIWAALGPAWIYVLSSLGAIVGYFEDIHPEDTWQIRLGKIVARLASSAFSAMMTFSFLRAMQLPPAWDVPMVGMAGYLGVEALREMGDLWRKRFRSGVDSPTK